MAIYLKTVESLLPRVVQWAEQEQREILQLGVPLSRERRNLATLAGVRSPERIHLIKVPFIAPPADPELAAFALLAGLITPQSTGLALGYAVCLRVDVWDDPLTQVEKYIHVAQHERLGSLKAFLECYISEFAYLTPALGLKAAAKASAAAILEEMDQCSSRHFPTVSRFDRHISGQID